VGLLTVGGAFAQLKIPHIRIWGDIGEPEVLARVLDKTPEEERRVPVLSSPRLAVERARDVLA
jgi:hypothetical protein